ncbi:MAG TPA: Bax inhibitor-1/YccA family protein [Herpetosiphonaceae bacterium]
MSYNPYTLSQVDARQRGIISQVYAWMTAGLLVTGAVAMFVASSEALLSLIFGTPLFFVLILAEFGLVWFLSARIQRMAVGTATALFLLYSMLNGLTLSVIFLAYTEASIATTFFITAGTFGAMSFYGYTTKRDLTSIGNLCFMALIGFLLASLVNLFLRSEAFYWLLTYVGVLIFVGLTAWDTQKIKHMSMAAASAEQGQRIAIYGALALYLDFINLFLLLLRILGRSDD